MRGKILTLALLLVLCTSISIEMGFASPEETTVSYTVTTGDVFPAMTDIDVSVTAVGYVKFTCLDGAVLPNDSTEYSITPNAESLNLTVNYDVDRPIIKRSGSKSKNVSAEWLLGDSEDICYTISTLPLLRICLSIHGHLNGDITTLGNGSATPSSITWSDWETKHITVSANANAENGQEIQVEAATEYVVYFSVKVEVGSTDVLEKDSPLKKVSGSPTIQFQIPVIPEFPSTVILLLTIVFVTFAVIIGKKRFPSPE